MKNVIKVLLVVSITLFAYQSHAQSVSFKGGVTLANMYDEDDNGTRSDDYDMNAGFHVGALFAVPISDIVSIEPGIVFTTKGMKTETTILGSDIEMNANLYYVDVPITIRTTFPVSNNVSLYANAGPYVGVGISGNTLWSNDAGDEETDIEWGSDENEDDMKRLDAGITVGAGLEINSILLGASYDYGLANISAYQGSGTLMQNRVLKISVGYKL
ncbi:MAG: porin family protein [Bacteroidales bacterium]